MIVTDNDFTRLASEQNTLTEIAKVISSSLELPELLDKIMKTVDALGKADAGAIMLWKGSSGLFRAEAAFGYDLATLKAMGLQAGESITGRVFDEGRACLFNSAEEITELMANMRSANRSVMARSLGSDQIPRCVVAAPITTDNQKFGVLVLETLDHAAEFTAQDLPFVQTLAELIALVIDRERLKMHADAVRETHRLERMHSEAMATLSHELRMPLTTIEGYATALQLDEVTWGEEKRREFLGLIEEACSDMEGMIHDILDSSLIDVDQLKIERRPTHLPQIAREVAAEVQQNSKAHCPMVDFPADFPAVEADPRWIKQVFRNIL
ncbi:MAG TPA: histidine kinase dimerization/phospho-acceptor domain-containing protein, partial [Longilinea sp.]|nr:histidine kinase dimerization/phospho-acceptor domain-containing protein [Longilinea sp.]